MHDKQIIQRKRFTVLDIVLIVAMVAVSVTALVMQSVAVADSDGLGVVVKKDSQTVYSASLADFSESTPVTVDEEFGLVICIEPDGVFVEHSDCSDKVCLNTGKITRAGQAIVCLPAHISVELVGDSNLNSDENLDVVVG